MVASLSDLFKPFYTAVGKNQRKVDKAEVSPTDWF